MTQTAEERAGLIAAVIFASVGGWTLMRREQAEAVIAAAIREAEAGAYERAARLAAGQYGAAGLRTAEDIRDLALNPLETKAP